MSDINMLYTAQAKTTATLTPGQANGLSKGTGLFSTAGLNFFDLLFAPSAEGMDGKFHKKDASAFTSLGLTPVASDTPVVETIVTPVSDNTATLDPELLDIVATDDIPADSILTSTTLDTDVSLTGTEQPTPVIDTPALNEAAGKKLAAVLENLLQGLPADQRPVVVNIKSGQLKQALKALNINPQDISSESQNLIATGLSPKDLTQLQNLLASDGTAEIDPDIQAFVVGMVKIMPDGAKGETIFLPKSLILTKADDAAAGKPDDSTDPSDELAAALNALEVGGMPPAAPQPQPAATKAGTILGDDGMTSDVPSDTRSGFDDVLKLLEQIQSKSEQTGKSAGIEMVPADKSAKAGPCNSTLGSSFHGMLGSMMSDAAPLSDYFPEGFDWSKNDLSAVTGSHITGPAQLASLVTQAQSATQPHPATQVVAATLSRAAQGGEDKTLKLQLDPPELGRIEVHMHFSKDKTMKAHMVIEKPETMLMLQRDSHVLERALQDAGLDTSGSGLSFELSSHNENLGGGGQFGYGGGRSDDNAPAEIIESTMTWHIDENTGHQHYNILA